MAQHDYNIANQSGADFRADLNNALLAIATVNSGATEPTTTFAHQLWVDTSSSVLKIRNAADNAWITTGVSITASNTFTGDLTGNVVGNVTGNLVGNVTGDLTGNADSADILSTARTISLSGDVVGSVSFDGSANVDIDTVVQINSITLGTDTTGDYVESLSGGTGVTVTGGTGEGSTPNIAIGQDVATTDDVTFNTITATDQFIGDIRGAVRFNAKADGALSKGDVVYISGVSGDVATVGQAKADDASKMPAFGFAAEDANDNAAVEVVTFGTLAGLDTSEVSEGQVLYVSTTAGQYTTTKPTGESALLQNIGKVQRSHASAGSIKVGGAGRSNATPNLNNGNIFIGNASNQSVTATLDTSIVVENTNLYYTTARANTDFDTRLATKDTGDLTEGSNLYYTTARVNTDFDTRLATKDTGDLTEGVNLYYTDARVNSAFDTRLATKDTDDLSEGTTNLYYTSSRANTDFDTRFATKSTTDLAEGTNLYYTSARFDSAFTSKDTDDLSEGTTNLYYTTARFDSAFGNKTTSDLTEGTNLYYTDTRANSAIDARVTKAFVDALGIQAASVDANSVTLGTDTVGNYVQTITGTANKITVSGSGSESADITLSLPDDVQIASDLTVAGNLTVNGTLTSLDTTNLDIEDNLFQLNAGLTGSPVNDSGMLINRGTADNGIFMWDESVDKFTLGLTTADGSATGNITLNSLGTLVANLEGNVTGAVTGTVSSLSNHDTGDLAEGSNLYYTQARFDSAFTAKSTSDLSEGSNLYYTDARFDTRLGTKDTDDVAEGLTNLYYTSARFNSAFGGKSTSDLSEGTNLYYTDARADARVNLQTGANLDLSSKSTSDLAEGTNLYYTSARANTDFDTRLATKDTDDLSEGLSNLYYTDARVQAVSINNVVEDTTPQLGGDLDLNSNDITGTGDINITGTVTASDLEIDSGTLSVDSTNNRVGIGTSSPSDKLEIGTTTTGGNLRLVSSSYAGNGLARFYGTDGNEKLQIGSLSATSAYIYTPASTDLVTYTGGSERMRIDSSGNVVVGHTAALGSATNRGNITINGSSDSVLSLGNGGSLKGYILQDSSGMTIYSDGATYQRFYTNGSERMRIDSSGNVKLITANDTAGTSKFLTFGTNSFNRAGIKCTNAATYDGSLEFYTGNSSNFDERMRIDSSGNVITGSTTANASDAVTLRQDGTVHANNVQVANGGGSAGGTTPSIYSPASGVLAISNNSTERLRVDGSGQVGIGETSPARALDVVSSTNYQLQLSNGSPAGHYELGRNATTGAFHFYGNQSGDIAYVFDGADGERMRIDASGNVGIGTSSPVTTAGYTSLTINNATNGGSLALQSNGTTAWSMSVDGSSVYLDSPTTRPIRLFANGSERMRIDSSGNVGIGTTSPTEKLDINGGAVIKGSLTNGAGTGSALRMQHSSNISEILSLEPGVAWRELRTNASQQTFYIAGGEKMRIDTSGNLLVGKTDTSVGSNGQIIKPNGETFHTIASANNTLHVYSSTASAYRFYVSHAGQINATSTSISAISDERLKENIVDLETGLSEVMALQPRRFDWKNGDGENVAGFIAQEVETVLPDLIGNFIHSEIDDAKSLKMGDMLPTLVKAIQEQQAQIEALQSEINELKNS